jgi:hypothetical protein
MGIPAVERDPGHRARRRHWPRRHAGSRVWVDVGESLTRARRKLNCPNRTRPQPLSGRNGCGCRLSHLRTHNAACISQWARCRLGNHKLGKGAHSLSLVGVVLNVEQGRRNSVRPWCVSPAVAIPLAALVMATSFGGCAAAVTIAPRDSIFPRSGGRRTSSGLQVHLCVALRRSSVGIQAACSPECVRWRRRPGCRRFGRLVHQRLIIGV